MALTLAENEQPWVKAMVVFALVFLIIFPPPHHQFFFGGFGWALGAVLPHPVLLKQSHKLSRKREMGTTSEPSQQDCNGEERKAVKLMCNRQSFSWKNRKAG